MNGPLLPRRIMNRRSLRRTWLLSWYYVLPLLCLVLPAICWRYSTLLLHSAETPPVLTPLQQLRQLKASHLDQDVTGPSRSISSVDKQQLKAAALDPVDLSAQITAAQQYVDSIVNPKKRTAPKTWHYVFTPESYEMRAQYKKVQEFLASPNYAARLDYRKKGCCRPRGIIINAGGPNLIASAMVTIKVLREVHNCTLPVELVWHNPGELDYLTLQEIQRKWDNVVGIDLARSPWPEHHRMPPQTVTHTGGEDYSTPPGQQEQDELPLERHEKRRAFMYKVWSLEATGFSEALLLDADNLPLTNPERLFDDASYKLNGNLFWPDFWPPGTSQEAQDIVYDMVGLDPKEAWAILAAGKGPGMSWRGTESGQVLFDLTRHGDVAEIALWINSFGDSIYRGFWGDKDTYALAFAVAGKAHEFTQIQVPPSGAFAWRPSSVLVKQTQEKQDGWQLAGMVQYDAWGQPAFLHRTMNKLSFDGEPWKIGLVTAPLPLSWIQYYLSLDSQGPTVGVPVTYAAPDSAFAAQTLQTLATAVEDCPVADFKTYLSLRQQAVPLGPLAALDEACKAQLTYMLGPLASRYTSARLRAHPELLAIGWMAMNGAQQKVTQQYGYTPTESPDPSPIVAWKLPIGAAGVGGGAVGNGSAVAQVVQASYEALDWVKQHARQFPLLAKASGLPGPQTGRHLLQQAEDDYDYGDEKDDL